MIRGIVYIIIVLVSCLLIYVKMQDLKAKRSLDVTTIEKEWQRYGKPVDILKIKRETMIIHEKISGIVSDDKRIDALVTSNIRNNIRTGMKFNARTGKTDIQGTVTFVSDNADISSGLFKIVLIPENNAELVPGEVMVAYIAKTVMKNVIKVPKRAMLNEEGKSFVWFVSEDNTVIKKQVQSGISSIDEVMILKGLNINDKIVLNGYNNLVVSDKIRIHKCLNCI